MLVKPVTKVCEGIKTVKQSKFKQNILDLFFLLRLVRKSSPWLLPFLLVVAVMRGANTFLSTTYLFQYALNALQGGTGIRTILLPLGCIFGLMLVYNILLQMKNTVMEIEAVKVEKYIQGILQEKAAHIDLACYEQTSFYDTQMKAIQEASGRTEKTLTHICGLLTDLITAGSFCALVCLISPVFLLLSLLPLIAQTLWGGKPGEIRYGRDAESKPAERRKEYVRRVFYEKDYAKELRLGQMYKVLFAQMRKSVNQLRDISRKYGHRMMRMESFFALLSEIIIYFGAIFLSLYRTLVQKVMLAGDCYVTINCVTQISYIVGDVGTDIRQLYEDAKFIRNIRTFLEYENVIGENPDGPAAGSLDEMRMEDVTFAYPGAEKSALKDVPITVPAGEKIAIVGANGAGKTTLSKLLLRFYEPQSGKIIYNGKPVSSYNLASYREKFACVFQDYQLFPATVAENVMRRGNLTDAEKKAALAALKKADLGEKIGEYPQGIDSTLTKEFDPEGIVLSGGQAQKVAVASALALDAPVVLLDEPSSALDPIAEGRMYRTLFDCCQGRTVIFISHRLSSVIPADRIYLINNGEIVQAGTHKELLAQEGLYARLWHMQAENYLDSQDPPGEGKGTANT